ncbi:MAG: putative acetyltransferase [Acidobacteria bacterium OLB17]|nr:MAG: putative acetyltransferase [Acidobacteria bacterium OLB17]MCZ2391289.1 GNAT family N-acetyltransferase [Acidobacteriota bacterium]
MDDPNFEITSAEPADASRLSDIAFAAKAYWPYPAEWLEIWRPQLTITTDDVANGIIRKLAADGEVRGFYMLREDGVKLWLEHLWVEPQAIGRGFGRKLFEHAVTTAQSLDHSEMLIESDPNAEGFYAAMGASRIGEDKTKMGREVRTLPVMEFKLKGN